MKPLKDFAEKMPSFLEATIPGISDVVVLVENSDDFRCRLGIDDSLRGLPKNCFNLHLTARFDDRTMEINQAVSKEFIDDAMFSIGTFLIYKFQDMILDLIEKRLDDAS